MRVLVADDSTVMRKIITKALKELGITDLVEAADGDEAVAKFVPGQFEAVLTDWNMPGKSGLEVLQAIRARDPNVVVMMVTTEAEKRRVLEAIQAGVTDYLTKPFESTVLKEKLEKHLGALA